MQLQSYNKLLQRLGSGFEAPIFMAYSARKICGLQIPFVSSPKARRVETRFPDAMANPYLAFSAFNGWT